MDLKEYYKFPEGSNVTQSFIPNWLCDNPNYPCPSNMSNAFSYYKGTYIPPLDTSNVTDMSYMFQSCSKLTSLDLSGLDTSKVTNMSYMFGYCTNLTSIDLSNWDTSKVTNMSYMFQSCSKLTSLDLSDLDTSKVTSMDGMFEYCKSLTSLSSLRADSLQINSWASPFDYSNNTLVDFGGFINLKTSWNGSYCVDKLTALSHQSLINILNGLYDFVGNGETPTSSQGQLKLGSTHLATLSDDEKAIATNKGWVLS